MSSQALLSSLQKLSPSINGLQNQIEPKLKAAVPTVAIEFPRATPEMLGVEVETDGEEHQKLLSPRSLAIAQKQDVEAGAVAVVQGAREMASQASAAVAVFRAQVFSFAISFGVGYASIMYLEAGSLIGPLANAVVVTLANVASFSHVLDVRLRSIFEAMQNQLETARNMLTSLLDAMESQLMGPLDEVTAAIGAFATSTLKPLGAIKDDLTTTINGITSADVSMPDSAALKEPITEAMAKVDALVAEAAKAADKLQGDYKDDLRKITAVEKQARKIYPDFDIPDPSDLPKQIEELVKKPMQAMSEEAGSKVDALLDTLKPPFDSVKQAQQQVKEVASSLDVPDVEAVLEPLNSSVGTIKDTAAKIKGEAPTTMNDLLNRTTIGTLMTSQWHFQITFVVLPVVLVFFLNLLVAVLTALHNMPSNTPQHPREFSHYPKDAAPEGWLPNTTKGYEMEALKPYYMPAVSQLFAMALQMSLTLLLTQVPVACKLLNHAIGSFEASLNGRINQGIDESIGQIMKAVFDAVRSKVSALTATLNDVITKGETLLLKAVDIEILQIEAEAAKQKVMSAGKEAAEKVDQTVKEEQEKLQTKVNEMEARIKKAAELATKLSDPSKAVQGVKMFCGGA